LRREHRRFEVKSLSTSLLRKRNMSTPAAALNAVFCTERGPVAASGLR
jgi:hypothetical protein